MAQSKPISARLKTSCILDVVVLLRVSVNRNRVGLHSLDWQ